MVDRALHSGAFAIHSPRSTHPRFFLAAASFLALFQSGKQITPPPVPAPLDALQARLGQVKDLEAAAHLLDWDRETYMPDGAAEARARQLSTLSRLGHELFTAEETGALLDAAAPHVEGADPLSFEASLVRVAWRDYARKRRLPADLVADLAEAAAAGQHAWKKARAEDDFAAFAPHLQRLLDLNRQKAEALGYDETPYDALLDEYEPGTTTATVERLFRTLREELVPLVEAIADAPPLDAGCLHEAFDPEAQWAFGEAVIRAFGYDFARGRQDRSAHPFTTSFSTSDVRITTRVDPGFFSPAFFATLHEAGHGLYEQGISPALARTPLAEGASLGVHESQSRLWENLVGRSRPFWQHYYPALQARFPGVLSGVDLDDFYRAINRVEPSLIRVEADEVTYNLHIMLRFELERALLEGDLAVNDLPARWNAAMEDYLGLRPGQDAEGVLQDVHWAMGAIGYFPTYALGNLMSVQLFEQAARDLGDLNAQLSAGRFEALLGWLRTNVHQHGRTLKAPDLLERVTGAPLQAAPWLGYIREKYGALYGPLSTE